WGAAESLRTDIGAQSELGGLFLMAMTPIERATYQQAVAAAQIQLGKEAFATAWDEGRTMTPEQALAAQRPVMMPTTTPAGLSTVPNAPKASPYHAGLTTREVEVLRLVAQWLTDTQLAQQLVISPRTVNWHLTSIYSKLQISSRSAATRYALEHKLV